MLRRMSPGWLRIAALGPLLLALWGCGQKDGAAGSGASAGSSDPWAERLAAPDLDAVLEALRQPHRKVRRAMGPHLLAYELSVTIGDPPGPNDRLPVVEVGEPMVQGQKIVDKLSLVWGEPGPDGPAFALSQSNDKARGRDVVIVSGKLYTRLEPRDWQVHGVETSVHELWLDDAQRAAYDMVEFAAPSLQVSGTAAEGGGLRGGRSVDVALAMREAPDPSRVASGHGRDWRKAASVTGVDGGVVLDLESGAWLSAEIAIEFTVPAADGREMRGSARFAGTAAPATAEQTAVSAPAEAQPAHSRVRYTEERARLLDGLAGP